MNKVEAKAKRKELLDQIYVLEKQRCENCNTSTLNKKMVHCKCPAASKIRKIGKQYEAIAIKARKGRLKETVASVKKKGLSIESYQTFKEIGLIDKDIYKLIGMDQNLFLDWKFEMGLTKNPRRAMKSQEKQVI